MTKTPSSSTQSCVDSLGGECILKKNLDEILLGGRVVLRKMLNDFVDLYFERGPIGSNYWCYQCYHMCPIIREMSLFSYVGIKMRKRDILSSTKKKRDILTSSKPNFGPWENWLE